MPHNNKQLCWLVQDGTVIYMVATANVGCCGLQPNARARPAAMEPGRSNVLLTLPNQCTPTQCMRAACNLCCIGSSATSACLITRLLAVLRVRGQATSIRNPMPASTYIRCCDSRYEYMLAAACFFTCFFT